MSAEDWFRLVEKEFRRRKTVIHVVTNRLTNLRLMNNLRRRARKAGYAWRFQREIGGVIVRKA